MRLRIGVAASQPCGCGAEGGPMDAASVREALERILGEPRLRRFRAQPPLPRVHRRGDPGRSCRSAEGPDHRDRRVRTRCPTFDPQHDPVVRIEAAKLRRRLERYYLTAGQQDPIRIDIPKGTYVPTFEERDGRPWTCPAGRRTARTAAAALPSGPGTPGRAGIGSRPPSSPFRFSGRWDGLARTCSLPDCGPPTAGTR